MCAGKFYITTPIYYVNGEPHIGHAYTTILADVLSRFHRNFGDKVFFLTGLDEHGQKVQQAARERGQDPQAHCDEMAQRFTKMWDKLHIKYDDFIRTTEPRHKEVVINLLKKCRENGDIYEGDYVGWYCMHDERYFAEKDLLEGNNCPLCNRPTQKLTEKNYFFRMSKYQEWLKDHIRKNPDFIKPESKKNEILGFLEKPLEDLCISRLKDRLDWGITLPFDDKYVCYVWIDALINYISAIGSTTDEDKFTKWWPAEYHLIGKDILTTHCVYWPTFLHSVGLEPPKTIFAHGWWLVDETKMSKSLGNVVKPIELIDKYGDESFRYFLMRAMTPGQDSNFNEELLCNTINSDLADNFGNVLSRLHKMIETYFEAKVPAPADTDEYDGKLKAAALEAVTKVKGFVENLRINNALEEIMSLLKLVNKYIVDQKPWEIAKAGNTTRLSTVLYYCAETLRIAGTLLAPIIPEKINSLYRQLGISDSIPENSAELCAWGYLKPGTKLGASDILFPKIKFVPKEKEETVSAPAKKEEQPKTKDEPIPGVITIDEFFKTKLKTAEVLEAKKVEGTDKLLHLKIRVGDHDRSLVAGIAKFYQPEMLIGKRIVIVSNLKPTKLRGILSEGMLLAAKTPDGLTLITTDNPAFPSGADIG